MDEKYVPDSIKNRTDLKALTYETLYTIVEGIKSGNFKDISVAKETSVSILTSYGIVIGTMVLSVDPKELDNKAPSSEIVTKVIYDSVFNGRNAEIGKRESENPSFHLINDSSAILLKNVIIKPYASLNNRIDLAFMILFADEIKGLSFGEFKQ